MVIKLVTRSCSPELEDDCCGAVGPPEGQQYHHVPPVVAGANVVHLAWTQEVSRTGSESTAAEQELINTTGSDWNRGTGSNQHVMESLAPKEV